MSLIHDEMYRQRIINQLNSQHAEMFNLAKRSPFSQEVIMTTQSVAKADGAVVELVSFTPGELDTITDALKIANAHYRTLAETLNVPANYKHIFECQSSEAGALQLKIEAAR